MVLSDRALRSQGLAKGTMMVHTFLRKLNTWERRPIIVIECSIPTERHFTACASLAALGVQLKHLDVFGPIRETVLIARDVGQTRAE